MFRVVFVSKKLKLVDLNVKSYNWIEMAEPLSSWDPTEVKDVP